MFSYAVCFFSALIVLVVIDVVIIFCICFILGDELEIKEYHYL
jgi:hypothetical protein